MWKIIVWLLAISAVQSGADAFDATITYRTTNVAGFKVLVSSRMIEHPLELRKALDEIKRQADEIEKAAGAPVFEFLRSVSIWLEWRAKANGAAEYHPSKDWLARNGYNPEKAQCIEINNAENFVKWSRTHQPSMLLHELAHAFHDQVLGWDDPDVKRAFKEARDSGRYEEVSHVDGRKTRSYALTDEKEYFAELTEAYFGRNDFYPFTRAELKAFDETGFLVVASRWKHGIENRRPGSSEK